MIISGHLQHDRTGRAVVSSFTDARVAEVDARRRAAEASIDALVVAWQGGAARHQRSGWHEWDDAARDAIDALSALLAALDLARREIADLEQGPLVPRQVDRRDH
ncbi:MAG TPA: WXG100 family type VII secretion target [Nocardioides sp.]|nr:WXG100 family type VII secretion target [Nocardioides sp.]